MPGIRIVGPTIRSEYSKGESVNDILFRLQAIRLSINQDFDLPSEPVRDATFREHRNMKKEQAKLSHSFPLY